LKCEMEFLGLREAGLGLLRPFDLNFDW
jgi:hypothetical protein